MTPRRLWAAALAVWRTAGGVGRPRPTPFDSAQGEASCRAQREKQVCPPGTKKPGTGLTGPRGEMSNQMRLIRQS